MKRKKLKFNEVEKDCKFRTYQENKCVNTANEHYRTYGSCQKVNCPLLGNGTDSNPKGCIELMSKVTILKPKIK